MRTIKDSHLVAQTEPEVEFAVVEVPDTHDYNLVPEALGFGDPDFWLPLATVKGPALHSSWRLWTVLPYSHPWCPTLGLAEPLALPVLWHQAPSDLK